MQSPAPAHSDVGSGDGESRLWSLAAACAIDHPTYNHNGRQCARWFRRWGQRETHRDLDWQFRLPHDL
jgi:hypothetical protein